MGRFGSFDNRRRVSFAEGYIDESLQAGNGEMVFLRGASCLLWLNVH